jgi:hypothetical protein
MPARSRTIGYSGSALELTLYPLTDNAQVVAFLWGGGGGGGGGDGGRPGGNGTGGGYSVATLLGSTGDQLRLFIGQGGGGGQGSARSASGGTGGSSYIGREVFGTRDLVGQFGLVARTLSYAWSSFMNANAVWLPYDASTVDFTTTVNIPITGNYELQGQCDDQATFYIDGTLVLTVGAPGYSGAPASTVIALSAGNHSLRMVGINSGGGPAGIAFTMSNGDSFSGAPGGRAGASGSSGGGGGGGGATVLLLNGDIAAVAGGGGGGAGAGVGSSSAPDAPDGTGQSSSAYNGQDGQAHPGDGGGGGGGGGGWNGTSPNCGGGGNGGAAGSGDTAGQPGGNGLSYGNLGIGENPLGRLPGGTDNFNYRSNTAMGGFGGYKGSQGANAQDGNNGYAVIYLTVPGVFVHNDSGGWVATEEIYTKVNDVWQTVNAIWIKREGDWIEAAGDGTTNFLPVPGFFGVVSRPYPPSAPVPGDGWTGDGWTGGSSPDFGGPVGAGQNADGSYGSENQG